MSLRTCPNVTRHKYNSKDTMTKLFACMSSNVTSNINTKAERVFTQDAMLGFLTRVVPHVRDSIRAETKITFTLFTPKWFFPSVSPHMYNKTIQPYQP